MPPVTATLAVSLDDDITEIISELANAESTYTSVQPVEAVAVRLMEYSPEVV